VSAEARAPDGSLVLGEADFADAEALSARLARAGLHLDAYEIRLARERFGRPLRWAEIVCLDILWSEHCSYKSTRPLLGRLPTEAPQVILGPGEDAGVVTLGEHEGKRYAAVIGHESHNHPSQVVPYEGAATGVGGIVRDVACMGARVVGTLDGLRFGTGAKKGGARTREIVREVVDGIADYGNALGIPNLGGDVQFDEGFDANCLVNVVAVGVVEADRIVRSRVPSAEDDWGFVLAGKPTDASGFGGASFASTVLSDEESERRGAVQLADPFLLRVLTVANEALLDLARREGWPIACKDLGAGGIACATVELAAAGGVGVDLELDQAHRTVEPLPPWVLFCSETQERYCWIVPWEVRERALAIFNETYGLSELYPGAGASVIGRSRRDGTYRVRWNGEVLVECPAALLTEGIRCPRPAVRRPPAESNGHRGRVPAAAQRGLPDQLLHALASPALASRSFLFERYDPDVQANTVVRRGDADAAVVAPVPGARWGLAVALGGNPWYGLADARWAAAHAVCEAARNVVAVGAQPWCLTDCLNFGSALDPLVMGDFESAIEGLAEAARELGTEGFDAPLPFVSGNVSLYNQDESGNAIPPSPIVACLGRVEDLSRVVTPGLKRAKHVLVYVGPPRGDLAGSHHARLAGLAALGRGVPALDLAAERRRQRAVRAWIACGWIEAAHDVGEGGLALAALEMAFASAEGLGLVIEWPALAADPGHETAAWWSEEPGFLVEVTPARTPELLRDGAAREVGAIPIGQVSAESVLRSRRPGHEEWKLDLAEARRAWRDGLAEAWELTEAPIGASR
jgi:phosphoribosylformylglycinamidine synthase